MTSHSEKVRYFVNRYVWLYLNFDKKKQKPELTAFIGREPNAEHLDTIATPYKYNLQRNGVRYIIECECQISNETAALLAGQMYNAEFASKPAAKKITVK